MCHVWLSIALGLRLKDTSNCLRTSNSFFIVGRGHVQGNSFIEMRELHIEDFLIFLNNYDRILLRVGEMKTLKNTRIINAITIHSTQHGLESVTSIALRCVGLDSAFL